MDDEILIPYHGALMGWASWNQYGVNINDSLIRNRPMQWFHPDWPLQDFNISILMMDSLMAVTVKLSFLLKRRSERSFK